MSFAYAGHPHRLSLENSGPDSDFEVMVRIRLSVLCLATLATGLLVGCGSDTPTMPTPLPETAAPPAVTTSLFVEVSIGQVGATRTALLERGPAEQALRIVASGRAGALGGPVDTLSGTVTLRDDTGAILAERDLDPLFAFTPILTPGADLVFDDVELDFEGPFPGFDGAPGEALVEIRGRDADGRTVSAQAMAAVSGSDIVPVSSTCLPDTATGCALDDRFKIDVDWRDSAGASGPGQIASGGRFLDGAEFFFLDPNNTDLLVQILDNCSQNDHFWVFLGSSTNVEFTVTVTDTAAGVTRPYFNPLGTQSAAITDTSAFATCP